MPLGRKWLPILEFLPGESHGQRSLVGGLQSMGMLLPALAFNETTIVRDPSDLKMRLLIPMYAGNQGIISIQRISIRLKAF